MSIQIADIDLTSAVVGTTGTISWERNIPPPTLAQQMRPQDTTGLSTVALFNESQCKLLITLPEMGQTFTLPAGRWVPIPVPANETRLTYKVTQIATGFTLLFSVLSADFFRPGEPVHDMGTLGNSPIGGNITTTPIFPTRVALQPRLATTSTTGLAVLSYLPPANQFLRVSFAAWLSNGTTPRNLSANVTFVDFLQSGGPPGSGVGAVFSVSAYSGASANVGLAMDGSNNFAMTGSLQYCVCNPLFIAAHSGTTVVVQFQDSAGTPNDFLMAMIEQVG